MTNLTPDFSFLSNFAECERRHYYEAERGLATDETVPVLHAGTAVHEALDTLYASGWNVQAAVDALYDVWGDYQVPRTHDHSFLSAGHLEVVVRNFADHYDDRPRETYAVGSDLFSERVFTIDWDGITVGGKIDLLEETTDGRLFLVDHKCTTSWLNSWWASRKSFRIGHQLRVYTAALQRELDVTLDGAYISGVYMGEKAADPPEKWESRQSSPFRLFGPFSFSDAQLGETRAWIERNLEQIQENREAESEYVRAEYAWPQNVANRYGCSSCDFEALCTASPRVRENKIEAKYVERELTGQLASGADSDD